MNRRALLLIVFLASMALIFSACSQSAEDDPEAKDDSVVLNIIVQNDNLFGFDLDEIIGRAFFSDSRGLVGSPVKVAITINEIERFDENDILVEVELENPEAIKLDEQYITHTFDNESSEFTFVIPQVLTVPTVLNYNVYYTVGTPGEGDYFEARTFFQFFVNVGTPAT